MEAPAGSFADDIDHRVRVARQRRERMRRRLLDSVLATCSTTSSGGPPSVETVIADADVSKATFYKYFTSVDEAVGVLGAEMAEEMVESMKAILAGQQSPLFQMTTAIQLFLMRSAREPLWARFVARRDALWADGEVRRGLTMHISSARDARLLEFSDLDAAITLAVGTLIEGMREAADNPGRPGGEFSAEVVLLILKALGVREEAARDLVRETAAFICTAVGLRLVQGRGPDEETARQRSVR